MSDTPNPPFPEEPPMVLPARQPGPRLRRERPEPPPARGGGGKALLVFFLLGSLALNFLLVMILFFSLFSGSGSSEDLPLNERFYSNDDSASDKVAVILIEGMLVDELMGYAHRQIDK